MRTFISINFDNKTIENILAVQRNLKMLGKGNFTKPENLHLTLAFLGEIQEDRIDELKAIIDDLSLSEMTLTFSHVGCFRNNDELWWIGIDEVPVLMDLQKELIAKLKAAGFSPDTKKFKPHITLARRMNIGRVDYQKVMPKKFSTIVDSIYLMKSTLDKSGPTYEVIHKTNF